MRQFKFNLYYVVCMKGLSTTLVPTEERLGCTSIFIIITISGNFSVDALAHILPVFSRIEKLTIVLEVIEIWQFFFGQKDCLCLLNVNVWANNKHLLL